MHLEFHHPAITFQASDDKKYCYSAMLVIYTNLLSKKLYLDITFHILIKEIYLTGRPS